MDSGLYNAIGAMNGNQNALSIISHNLANLNTHGYKRRTPNAEQFAALTNFGQAKALGTNAVVDFGQGDLEVTGSPFHLALEGDGMFAAESPEGEVYTRYGAFTIDDNGTLVTEDGYPLAWEERLIDFDPMGPPPTVDTDGQVTQGPVVNGRLKIAAFENPARLREVAGGYWSPTRETPPAEPTAMVRQGRLERSNSTGIVELLQMIETQRAYEVAAKTVRSIDQSYQALNQSQRG
ncbi:MAG: flagellar hook-basal body protein [Planctomycetota bacterium]|jgi:flagellar basal-body rod protein FlgF